MSRVLPILFNGDMVRAILDGKKTVTRRVIMPHNRKKAKEQGYCQGSGLWIDPSADNGDKEGHIKDYSISPCWSSYSWYIDKYAPYKKGDILYVRETWVFVPCVECNMGELISTRCKEDPITYDDEDSISEGCFLYRASYPDPQRICWRPSIHMPKQAAHIWLKVTDVRVEQLHGISPEDLRKEGMELNVLPKECESQYDKIGAIYFCQEARKDFSKLWDSTIKKQDLERYGWNVNPWVWVIEFEWCEKPEVEDA